MTFPAGVTSVSLNITIINDIVLESNVTFNLTLTEESLPDNIILGEINTTKVIIVNDGVSGEYGSIVYIYNCSVGLRLH